MTVVPEVFTLRLVADFSFPKAEVSLHVIFHYINLNCMVVIAKKKYIYRKLGRPYHNWSISCTQKTFTYLHWTLSSHVLFLLQVYLWIVYVQWIYSN